MKKVLIIDDDIDILESMQFVLEEEGYVVKTISSGQNLISEASSFNPEVILLDYLISGLSGIDICKDLKNDARTKEIPVIFISAHPQAKSISLDAGADYFLAKPFEIEEMLTTLKTFE